MEMVELLKRNALVDQGLVDEENNPSYQKNKSESLEILPNLPAPLKRQKLSRRVGKGSESHNYFALIKIPKNLECGNKSV